MSDIAANNITNGMPVGLGVRKRNAHVMIMGMQAWQRDGTLRDRLRVSLNDEGCEQQYQADLERVHAWFEAVRERALDIIAANEGLCLGEFGSVWTDANLAGAGVTRRTRLCLYPRADTRSHLSGIDVMIDPTFTDTWCDQPPAQQ